MKYSPPKLYDIVNILDEAGANQCCDGSAPPGYCSTGTSPDSKGVGNCCHGISPSKTGKGCSGGFGVCCVTGTDPECNDQSCAGGFSPVDACYAGTGPH